MKPARTASLACLVGIAIAACTLPASAQTERQSWPSAQSVYPGTAAPEPMMEPGVEPYPGGRAAPSPGLRPQPVSPQAPAQPGYRAPSQPAAPGSPKTYQKPSTPVTPPAQRPSVGQPVSPGLRGPRQPSPNQPVSPPRGYGAQPPSRGGVRPPAVEPPDWPIKRPPNPVTVRPPRDPRYWGDDRWRDDRWRDDRWRHDHRYDYRWHRRPLLYLPLIVFGGGVVYDGYGYSYDRWRSRLLWEDSVVLGGEEGWVEFSLDSGMAGQKLWLEIRDGRAQIDWAEVVFNDGTSQVIDFNGRSLGPGLYALLDFYYYRGVEFVRMVARSTTDRVWIILRLES